MSRGRVASGAWILLGVGPDEGQIGSQGACFIAMRRGLVREGISGQGQISDGHNLVKNMGEKGNCK